MKLAKEWITRTVTLSASDIENQQRAFSFRLIKAHLAAADSLDKAKGDTIVQGLVYSRSEKITTTAQVFCTANKEIK